MFLFNLSRQIKRRKENQYELKVKRKRNNIHIFQNSNAS